MASSELCVCVHVWVGGLEYLIKNRLQNTFSALISLRTVVWWVGVELLLLTLVSCEFSLTYMVHWVTVFLVNPLQLLFGVQQKGASLEGFVYLLFIW